MPAESESLLLHQIIAAQGAISADLSAMRDNVIKTLTRLEVIEAGNQAANLLHADHETRLRLLERFRYTLLGVSIVVGLAAGIAGDLIGHAIH